jgi:hypothetical protein
MMARVRYLSRILENCKAETREIEAKYILLYSMPRILRLKNVQKKPAKYEAKYYLIVCPEF